MPTYDYKCSSCDTVFSRIRKVATREEPTKEPCPECSASDLITIHITTATPFNYDNRMGAYKMTDSFSDKLKEMKKNCGKENTINV